MVYCSAALVGAWEVALERPISVLSTLLSVGCHEIVVVAGDSGRMVCSNVVIALEVNGGDEVVAAEFHCVVWTEADTVGALCVM